MRYLLIIQIILFISCSLQPEDCNGVLGGTAEIDDCGGCIGGDTGKEACEDLDQDMFDDTSNSKVGNNIIITIIHCNYSTSLLCVYDGYFFPLTN